MDKKRVREQLCGLGESYQDVFTLDEFAVYVRRLTKPYEAKGYSHFTLQYTAYYESSGWALYGERDETDQEYKYRTKEKARQKQMAEKAAHKQLVQEKKEYKRLKRKFESKSKEES